MTDSPTTDTTNVVEDAPSDDGAPKQLREALKREKAENAKLREQLMGSAFAEVGLDPKKGLGKAIAKEYDGDPTAESLLTYAQEEYDYEVAAAPENPMQPTIAQGQAQLDRVQDVSASVVPPSEQETLNKAQSEGDWNTAGRIKANQLERLMKPR